MTAVKSVSMGSALKTTSAHVSFNILEGTVKLQCAPFPANTKGSVLHLTPANVLRPSQVTIVRHLFVTLPAKMVDCASARTCANALAATQALHVQPRSAASHVKTVVLA